MYRECCRRKCIIHDNMYLQPKSFHPPLTYMDSPSGLLHSSTCCINPHSDSVVGVVSHSYGGLGGASSD